MYFHTPVYSDGRKLPADVVSIFRGLEADANFTYRIRTARQRIASGNASPATVAFMAAAADDDPEPEPVARVAPSLRLDLLRPQPAPHIPLASFNAAAVGDRLAPERRWVVEGWLPIGRVTLLYADGGIGKTTAAQHLMTACATGLPWFGMEVMPCRSVALFCEDDLGEVHYRQDKINAALGLSMDDLGPTDWMAGIGSDNALMTFDRAGVGSTTERFAELRERSIAAGARLVVIDASAGTFGGSEIDRPQVSKFVGQVLTRLALDIDGAVLLLAHPSKSGMAAGGSKDSGSTAWSNSARSRWSFTRPVIDGVEIQDERVLALEKANWSQKGSSVKVRWQDGVFVPVAHPGGAADGLIQQSAEQVFLDLLAACEAVGLPVSASPSAGNCAAKVFARRPDARGLNQRQFNTAMHALLASEKIHLVSYGSASRGTLKLAIKVAS